MGTQSITNQIISAVQTFQIERVSVASDGTEANERQPQSLNLGRWPLRNLLQRCLESGSRGHQRRWRHLRVRPTDRRHHARLGGQRRH